MKKTDWLIVAVLMGVGAACLLISAFSFSGMSLLQAGLWIGRKCLFLMVLAGIIGVAYHLYLSRRGK